MIKIRTAKQKIKILCWAVKSAAGKIPLISNPGINLIINVSTSKQHNACRVRKSKLVGRK